MGDKDAPWARILPLYLHASWSDATVESCLLSSGWIITR
jgi:hypothetical protein